MAISTMLLRVSAMLADIQGSQLTQPRRTVAVTMLKLRKVILLVRDNLASVTRQTIPPETHRSPAGRVLVTCRWRERALLLDEWARMCFCISIPLVCRQDRVPESTRSERDGRCLRVAGALDFAEIGVLSQLAAPLAMTGISIFVVSTFDTDYQLVKNMDLARATAPLESAGHEVSNAH